MDRSCGILLPVTCLPSPGGIGGFSREAYEFVDFLERAGQTWWQVLPMGQTGSGDSPYQSISTFAGNPYYIDVQPLVDKGYLTQEDVHAANAVSDPRYVDYDLVCKKRFALLRKAFENSPYSLTPPGCFAGWEYGEARSKFDAFMEAEKNWLYDYTLFCAVKAAFGGKPYMEWDEDIRLRRPEAMERYGREYAQDIRFYAFMQYIFSEQWMRLKAYAQGKGIRFIGDLPIYVALDSAEAWSHPELFMIDGRGYPSEVAGCPPDAFSATGQLWGNPLYNWDYHRQTGYDWWISRLEHCFRMLDMVRIDHFRGFDEYWAVPYGQPTAQYGQWKKGPGYDFFQAVERRLGKRSIIAEDLGFLTPSVYALLEQTGYPGMKVLQFAFNPWDDSVYLPHNFKKNCVVYTGTHDNDTTRGWFENASREEREFAGNYADVRDGDEVAWKFIRLALESVADLAVIPIQDYLNIGQEGRFNKPSTVGDNWKWRLLPGELTPELADRIRTAAVTYRRTGR
ncbi:MAG: 4-alpha-glucanotransferase [Lachnospiraceae bacterium]|nr:4-alpha-glucanotransferase [Lachnospiraceae bacterium]